MSAEGSVGSVAGKIENMSGAANPSSQDEDKKPNDQSGHINLKVKGQVHSFDLNRLGFLLFFHFS